MLKIRKLIIFLIRKINFLVRAFLIKFTQMKKRALDFVIDKLTNSIQHSISGASFKTSISLLMKEEASLCCQLTGWNFDWGVELLDQNKRIYKLVILNFPDEIHGLLSVTIETDHIFIHLLENAPLNMGKDKRYLGVMGNLVGYACKLSFQNGLDGFVAFTAKTNLVEHYKERLGAHHVGNGRMIIEQISAQLLIDTYFK